MRKRLSSVPLHRMRQTADCLYWQEFDTYHSIVAVGHDATTIYVNDPQFADAPIQVAKNDFWLAWLEMSNRYIVLSLV